jgi:hypothetical protein
VSRGFEFRNTGERNLKRMRSDIGPGAGGVYRLGSSSEVEALGGSFR